MTFRLLAMAAEEWSHIDGRLASRGIDPWDLPLPRLCSLIYHWATEAGREDPNAIKKFDARLWMPPKGEAPAAGSAWDPAQENAAFRSLKASLNTPDVSTSVSKAAGGGGSG